MSSHQGSEFEAPPVFHDKSKWEEPPGDPRLTLWDLCRVPRAPPVVVKVDPDHKIRLPVKVLPALVNMLNVISILCFTDTTFYSSASPSRLSLSHLFWLFKENYYCHGVYASFLRRMH
jgi:hypothetical protein